MLWDQELSMDTIVNGEITVQKFNIQLVMVVSHYSVTIAVLMLTLPLH